MKEYLIKQRNAKLAHIALLEKSIEERTLKGNLAAVEKIEQFWFRATEDLEAFEIENGN